MGAEPATPQPIREAARPGGRGSPGAQGAGLRLTVLVAGQLSQGAVSAARRRELERRRRQQRRRRRRRRRRVPARSGSWRSGVASRGGGGGGGGVRAMLRVSLGAGVLTSS